MVNKLHFRLTNKLRYYFFLGGLGILKAELEAIRITSLTRKLDLSECDIIVNFTCFYSWHTWHSTLKVYRTN